ncbi:MAG: iron complex outermembrane receptor protein, partial [Gammaproteobacteria bacterium]
MLKDSCRVIHKNAKKITKGDCTVKLNKIALVIAMSGLSSTYAFAQQATEDLQEEKIERISVTGSSIKRASLGDLPITMISAEQISAAGITSAEQLLSQLNISSNSNDNLASNAGIVGGEERGNNGASSANLRQQGAGSTLVLLNGRRVATHGLKGRAVDLNSIPFAAIERVEIFSGGATAMYGTDAIGGVINFILRKNYEGVQAGAFADHTEEGSGNIYRINLLAGTGNLDEDGFNLMASVSMKSNEILRGDDRDFTTT